MKLYNHPMAPNPHKVRIYLIEKGLDIPLEHVELGKGENRTPEFLSKNPMGSLPVLELDDGTHLTESLVIIQYLEELHPEPNMIGQTPLERARVREFERLIETSVFNRITRIFFHTHPFFAGSGQIAELAEKTRNELPRVLGIVDARIGDSPFAAGDTPTIADCTLFASLALAKRVNISIGTEHKNLYRWFASFSARPSGSA